MIKTRCVLCGDVHSEHIFGVCLNTGLFFSTKLPFITSRQYSVIKAMMQNIRRQTVFSEPCHVYISFSSWKCLITLHNRYIVSLPAMLKYFFTTNHKQMWLWCYFVMKTFFLIILNAQSSATIHNWFLETSSCRDGPRNKGEVTDSD